MKNYGLFLQLVLTNISIIETHVIISQKFTGPDSFTICIKGGHPQSIKLEILLRIHTGIC